MCLTSIYDAEQLYTATAAVLDASTRVAAATGSGVIDLADGLQVASTVLMLGLARKLILLRASRRSVSLNGYAQTQYRHSGRARRIYARVAVPVAAGTSEDVVDVH